MQTSRDEVFARLDPAAYAFAELSPCRQRDLSGLRVLLIPLLERRLYGTQFVGLHMALMPLHSLLSTVLAHWR
jgi:hypothetical protein